MKKIIPKVYVPWSVLSLKTLVDEVAFAFGGKHHRESSYTKNVNKLGDMYIRSVILIELVVLRENKWTTTFSVLFFFFLICTRTKQVYSIDGPKFRLELKQLLFPLFRLDTTLVKNLETLVCVSPFPMLI